MKAPVKKSIAVKKTVVKAKVAPAKKASAKAVSKPSKAAAKPVAKKAAAKKAAAKTPVTKTAAKQAKPVAKPKPAAKPASKPAKPSSPAKSPAKSAAKPVAKPAVKQASKPAKTAPATGKAASKASPKATPKAPIKAPVTAKATAKTPAKAPPAPAKAPAAKAAPAKPVAKAVAPEPVKTPSAPAPVAPAKTAKTSKSGFNSPANIAPKPMEVSTAAKTNFTMSSPVLAPPPQVAVKKDAKLVNNWKTKSAAELTDQEVIAMPDSEYMNALQMAFFRLKLVQLKKDILSNAGETTEHLREDTSVVPDPADRATIEEEHALELRTRDRERKLLKKIEQSIARIDADDYGFCDETGEPIGVARLIARPTASLSLEAQQRRELKQKMFGD